MRVTIMHLFSSILSRFYKPKSWLLLAILIGGLFFRFYNAPDRFGFDKDPARDVLVTLYGANHHLFPLVGPASGIGSFTFGPWYYYQLILFKIIFPFSFSPFYYVPLFSLPLIAIMYLIGKELSDDILGIVLATFTAFSPSLIAPTTALSNPSLIPTFAGACLLVFLLLYKKRSRRLSFLWGVIIAIGISIHYEMIPLLILPAMLYSLKWKGVGKDIWLFVIGLILPSLPFIYFNSVNNWHTINGFIHFLGGGGTNNYIPNNWHIYLFEFWPKYLHYIFSTSPLINYISAVVIICVYLYRLFIQKSLVRPLLLFLITFFIFFIGLRYFNASREYYYFLFLEPLLIVIVGFALHSLTKIKYGHVLLSVCLLLFVVLSLPENIHQVAAKEGQVSARKMAQDIEKTFSNRSIVIYNCRQLRIERAMGVTFFLTKDKKLADIGEKVGFTQDEQIACKVPISAVTIAKDVYDLSSTDDVTLEKLGWFKISPESVYKNTVLWWTSQNREI